MIERIIGMESLRKMFGTQDMTVGKPLSNLASFSIPLLIGNFAQQMYNTVDSIVVGKYVGDNALAAVGASGPKTPRELSWVRFRVHFSRESGWMLRAERQDAPSGAGRRLVVSCP